MEDPVFPSTARIAILGLGLMGGSLAMALHGKCASLLGIDPDQGALSFALQKGFVNKASTDPARLLPEADVVILAAPVGEICNLVESLPQLHPGKALVLDLGSTKKEITAAMSNLPWRFEGIGGHPICGKEKSGLENADAGLYQGAPFVLTPLAGTTPSAKAKAAQLVKAVGAHPLWLDAETHDRWIAYTSHLPYLLALALATATPPEALSLAGFSQHQPDRGDPRFDHAGYPEDQPIKCPGGSRRFAGEFRRAGGLPARRRLAGARPAHDRRGRPPDRIDRWEPSRRPPMNLTISPGKPLHGQAGLPGDKSLSHRAALLAGMAQGESVIQNFLVSGVTEAMLAA